MAKFYSRMKGRADRLLPKYGAAYQVTRKGKIIIVAGKETKEPDSTFAANGVKTEYSPGEIDGTVIKNGDIRIVFCAEPEIKIGDMVSVDGVQLRVVKPNPVKPADLLLCYRVQLRA